MMARLGIYPQAAAAAGGGGTATHIFSSSGQSNGSNQCAVVFTGAAAGDLAIIQCYTPSATNGSTIAGWNRIVKTWAATASYTHVFLWKVLTSGDLAGVTITGMQGGNNGSGATWSVYRGPTSIAEIGVANSSTTGTLPVTGFTKDANCYGIVMFAASKANNSGTVPTGFSAKRATRSVGTSGANGQIAHADIVNPAGYTNGATITWTALSTASADQEFGIVFELRGTGGGGGSGSTIVWDATFTHAEFTGGGTNTITKSATAWRHACASLGIATGEKKCFEIVLTGSPLDAILGIDNKVDPACLNSYAYETNVGMQNVGNIWQYNVGHGAHSTSYGAQAVGIYVDNVNMKMWWTFDNVTFWGLVGASTVTPATPATGEPFDAMFGGEAVVYPAASLYNTGQTAKVRSKLVDFTVITSPVSGFSALEAA